MEHRKLAVLGGGNGAFAMAADFALQGFEVRLWSKFPEELKDISLTKIIKVSGPIMQGDAHLSTVTDNLQEAVTGADLICIPLPAFTQQSIAKSLGPYLEDGQVIFFSPGSFGSYIMAKSFKEQGYWKDIALAETGTLPYLTRKISSSESSIVVKAIHLPTGVFPARKTAETIDRIRTFFPVVEGIEDALSGALLNSGLALHSPLVVMNTGAIEHFPAWDPHNEGTTPSIHKIITLLDNERIAVREALGYESYPYPLEDHYDESRPHDFFYPRGSRKSNVDSGKWREKLGYQHRYVTEDMACGLAFLVSLGDYTGVPVPLARSMLSIAGAVNGVDYRKEGRTLESTGLAKKSLKEIKELLYKGW